MKYNSQVLTTIIVLLSFRLSFGQGPTDWLKFMRVNGYGAFQDIYHTDDGYLACGGAGESRENFAPYGIILLNKYDEDGNDIWSTMLENYESQAVGYSLIEADNGDILVAGLMRNNGEIAGTIWRISPDGDLIWRRIYDTESFYAIIELKDGRFAVAGSFRSNITLIEENGDVVWERNYSPGYTCNFIGLRETDGGIVAAGTGRPNRTDNHYYAVKVEIADGDQIWANLYNQYEGRMICRGMTSTGDGGFVLCGNNFSDEPEYGFILRISDRGNVIWDRVIQDQANIRLYNIIRLIDDGFAVAGHYDYDRDYYDPALIRLNRGGEINWIHHMELSENELVGDEGRNMFTSLTSSSNNDLVVCGVARNAEDGYYDPIVLQIGSDILTPEYLFIHPRDSLLTVIQDSTVLFAILCDNPRFGELDYRWTYLDTLRSVDDTCLISFNQIGEYGVHCDVTSYDWVVEVTWHVTVTDLNVSAFTPDTLDLAIRRGTSVDFSLDTIRFTDGAEPEILWTKTNLSSGQSEVTGRDAGATIDFPWSGEYSVEGRVSRGESSDAVTWHVNVKGAIWAFVPVGDSLLVLPDSVVHFEVVPSAPEDESLEVQWLVDGELVREGELTLDWAFGEADSSADLNRHYLVQCVVTDSVEADTVRWIVTVNDLSIADPAADPPRSVALLEVSPNPFNSTLTIQYATGGLETAATRLAIYDIAGREVVRLPGSTGVSAGQEIHPATEGGATEHQITWDASTSPAGVYFVRLQSGSEIVTQKVVLMR